MSAAATTANAGVAKKGKAKLMIIIAAVLVVLLLAGGAAMFLLKKKAATAEGSEDSAPAAAHKTSKVDPKHPPTFVPLDAFVVNLSDKEADRYAQIGITLEVEGTEFAEQMKVYMPSIRNGILMILAHKSSQELLERTGKEKLAGQIQREVGRTMGLDIEEPEAESDQATASDGEEPEAAAKPKSKAKKRKAPVEANPVHQVLFSNFIIQ